MTHLWEIDHPYYCTEGNYLASGSTLSEVHTQYESWSDFFEDWGDSDPDMNLVFRWDWHGPDPSLYVEGEDVPTTHTLLVHWVLQRKAYLRSTAVEVTEADEPAVRAWLAERAKKIAAIWEPFMVAGGESK